MDADTITRRVTIHGRVQGVGFRYHFNHAARELGISGWVRNRRNGTVEAMVSGTPAQIASMIEWAKRGPPSAVVERVEVAEASETFKGFQTLPTA